MGAEWSEPVLLEGGEILAPVADTHSDRGFRMQFFVPDDPEHAEWLAYIERRDEQQARENSPRVAFLSRGRVLAGAAAGLLVTGVATAAITVFSGRDDQAASDGTRNETSVRAENLSSDIVTQLIGGLINDFEPVETTVDRFLHSLDRLPPGRRGEATQTALDGVTHLERVGKVTREEAGNVRSQILERPEPESLGGTKLLGVSRREAGPIDRALRAWLSAANRGDGRAFCSLSSAPYIRQAVRGAGIRDVAPEEACAQVMEGQPATALPTGERAVVDQLVKTGDREVEISGGGPEPFTVDAVKDPGSGQWKIDPRGK